jgi:hypothetical protein
VCTTTDALSNVTTNTFIIGNVANLVNPTFTPLNEICSGEVITLPSTSTNGITGAWLPAIDNEATTTYTFTPNAGQCATTTTMTVTVNPLLTASVSIAATPSNVVCSGTSVTFTATPINGGSTPSYQWYVGSTPVGTDNATYTSSTLTTTDSVTVVMTSNASPCLTSSPATSNAVVMTVNSYPTSASITGTNGPIVCSGNTISFTVMGTSGDVVSYNLNGGANDTATLIAGTATIVINGAITTQTLNLISVSNGSCSLAIGTSATVTIETTTWSNIAGGSWSNGAPSLSNPNKSAIISFDYSIAADFYACSLTVNNDAAVSVTSGTNVNLNGAITVASGSFTLNNNANLYQADSNAVNSGNIIVKRQTNPLIRLDYSMWSSPVSGQGLYAFSPFTFDNRFYSYATSSNLYNNSALGFSITGLNVAGVNGTDSNNVPFTTAKGYLIRLPYNHPTAPVVWNGTFTGVPNNGTKTITLTNVSATQQFNLVGNPYPSPINIAQFALDNAANIEPTLYFWRKTNNTASPSYCTWNTASATFGDNGETFTTDPAGIIQTGQGFIVEAKDGASSLVFNNTQRLVNNANQFFKTNSTATPSTESHRIWLNLTGSGAEFSQAVVGYFTNATLGTDDFDSKYFNDGPVALNTKLGTDEFVIQGRPTPFDTNDVVPLNFKVATAGTYTFAIDHVDGLFTAGAQSVYIKDNSDGTYHNLTTAPFVFTSVAGTFANRFELVYQTALSVDNNEFLANSIRVIQQQNNVVINTGLATMATVRIYDIRGRLLQERKAINASETSIPVGTTSQVLLVEVTTINGAKATKKVIN